MNIANFNGYRGEQRTKAILSDKFVLLTTSIDENGADMLIRKINDDNPSMAVLNTVVIQSKYIQNLDTAYLRIKREYIEDKEGTQNFGFALMIHSEEFNKSKVIFYSFQSILELIKNGDVYLESTREYYAFPKSVINDSKYDYTPYLDKLNNELQDMLEKKSDLGKKCKAMSDFTEIMGRDVFEAGITINNILDTFKQIYSDGGITNDQLVFIRKERIFENSGKYLVELFNELQFKVDNYEE